MLMVVPGKELLAETARILNGTEAIRIARPVFHGLEVRFRKGVVIGNMGSAVSPDNAEVCEQQGQ